MLEPGATSLVILPIGPLDGLQVIRLVRTVSSTWLLLILLAPTGIKEIRGLALPMSTIVPGFVDELPVDDVDRASLYVESSRIGVRTVVTPPY